jgi:hypothetical protein
MDFDGNGSYSILFGRRRQKKTAPITGAAFCDPEGIRTPIKGTGILHSIH